MPDGAGCRGSETRCIANRSIASLGLAFGGLNVTRRRDATGGAGHDDQPAGHGPTSSHEAEIRRAIEQEQQRQDEQKEQESAHLAARGRDLPVTRSTEAPPPRPTTTARKLS